jgi:hypothetical protein
MVFAPDQVLLNHGFEKGFSLPEQASRSPQAWQQERCPSTVGMMMPERNFRHVPQLVRDKGGSGHGY